MFEYRRVGFMILIGVGLPVTMYTLFTIRGALSQRAGVWRLQVDPGSIATE